MTPHSPSPSPLTHDPSPITHYPTTPNPSPLTSAPPRCLMPGCTNPADSGMKLCSACRGDEIPAPSVSVPLPLSGLTPAKKMQAMANRKRLRVAHNRKPRVTLTCACGCGKTFQVPEGIQAQTRKYFNMECKKRHFKPDGLFREKYPLPEGFEAELREVYENRVRMERPSSKYAPAAELAKKYGIPRWKVSRCAMLLGLTATTRRKMPPWSEAELQLLSKSSHLTPHAIAARFRRAGYVRSEAAIVIKLTRTGARALADVYTSREVSDIFGVDSKVIRKWIGENCLAAERRGTARVGTQLGDIWNITTEAIRQMIKHYPELVDFRKIDKYFVARLL